MSPIAPIMSREFHRQAKELAARLGADPAELEVLLVAVANNFYPQFEKRGKVAFGCLDQRTDKEWTKAPVYFVVAMRFQTFQFFVVTDEGFSEENKAEIGDVVKRLLL